MKKQILFCLIFLLILTGCGKKDPLTAAYPADYELPAAGAEETRQLLASNLAVFDPDALTEEFPEVSAAMLADVTTGEAIFGDHVFDRLYPASLTKLATAYVTFLYGDLTDTVTFSKKASHITEPGARLCRFEEGDSMNLGDLVHVMLVYSGNDAALAVAEHIGGSEKKFCEMMNEELEKLGAVNTHFTNPHGLPDEDHYTTAYDIYLVFSALLRDERFLPMIQSEKVKISYQTAAGKKASKTFESTNQYVLNKVKPPKGVTVFGGKTGTTNAAGNCMILLSEGADKHQYISLILHAETGEELYQYMTQILERIGSGA